MWFILDLNVLVFFARSKKYINIFMQKLQTFSFQVEPQSSKCPRLCQNSALKLFNMSHCSNILMMLHVQCTEKNVYIQQILKTIYSYRIG